MSGLDGARVLITGSRGFAGACLAGAAAAAGATVFGIDKSPARQGDAARSFVADLRGVDGIQDILRTVEPTHIAHLAGALPGPSSDFAGQYDVNTIATASLFEAIVGAHVFPVVMIASSSAVYGPGRPGTRLCEDDEPAPVSHYGVSKLGQEMVARMYHRSQNVPTIIVRTFNLVGRRQSSALMASDIARQIALAERTGGPAVLRVGSLTPVRDFVDVRDAARAYIGLLQSAEPGTTYNVCRGVGHTVGECVDMLVQSARVPLEVQQESGRLRSTEIQVQVGDPTRLHSLTGWKADTPLAESLRDVLEYWREQA